MVSTQTYLPRRSVRISRIKSNGLDINLGPDAKSTPALSYKGQKN
jgi:hypothetical protein